MNADTQGSFDENILQGSPWPWGQLLDALNVVLVGVDGEGRIALFNKAAERTSGYTRENVLGQSFVDRLVAAEERPKVRSVLEHLFAGPTTCRFDMHWITKDREQRLIRYAAVSLGGEGGEPSRIIGLGIDATHEQNLAREVVEVDEQLRQWFGAELHDMLGSHLAGTVIMASALAGRNKHGGDGSTEQMQRLTGFIREAMEQVRVLSHRLIAPELETEGLGAALEQLAERANAASGVTCVCCIPENSQVPTDETALHLYRIAQEVVQSAITQATPSRIDIVVEREDDGARGNVLILEICCDGRSMPGEDKEKMGLRMMQHRAELIGATLQVETTAGGRTFVRCVLPLPDNPRDG